MDPLRIVAPGDSYEPSAARENAWTEAARWVRERQLNSNRTPMAGLAGTTVLVKNQSGSDRDQFEILAVDDHLVTPADNLKEFQRRIGLAGKTPAAQHAGQFVVLAQPIKADSIGPAFASGAVAVKIKMVSESHPYWVPTQLAAGGQITRQTVEQQFGVSDRTAKRELSELCDWGMIEFDRSRHPGWYRLKYLAPLC